MRWLCTLVTPPGGRILDPFAGSGTTLQAALECGFDPVGIESDPKYVADINRRLTLLRSRRRPASLAARSKGAASQVEEYVSSLS
jgi:site-specific DNA-methyltransferase (adenine-specific)